VRQFFVRAWLDGWGPGAHTCVPFQLIPSPPFLAELKVGRQIGLTDCIKMWF